MPPAGTAIRFGLGAVQGVGSKAIEAIIARAPGRPVHGLADFCQRVQGQQVNRRVIESLIKCGAFDSLERNRAARCSRASTTCCQWAGAAQPQERTSTQMGLFAGGTRRGERRRRRRCPTCRSGSPRRSCCGRARDASASSSPGIRSTGTSTTCAASPTSRSATLRTRGPELPPSRRATDAQSTAPGPARRRDPHRSSYKNSQEGRPLRDLHSRGPQGRRRGDRLAGDLPAHETVDRSPTSRCASRGTLEVSEERCQIIADEVRAARRRRAPRPIRQVHVARAARAASDATVCERLRDDRSPRTRARAGLPAPAAARTAPRRSSRCPESIRVAADRRRWSKPSSACSAPGCCRSGERDASSTRHRVARRRDAPSWWAPSCRTARHPTVARVAARARAARRHRRRRRRRRGHAAAAPHRTRRPSSARARSRRCASWSTTTAGQRRHLRRRRCRRRSSAISRRALGCKVIDRSAADPRHLRAARAQPRGQAAGRAGAARSTCCRA